MLVSNTTQKTPFGEASIHQNLGFQEFLAPEAGSVEQDRAARVCCPKRTAAWWTLRLYFILYSKVCWRRGRRVSFPKRKMETKWAEMFTTRGN